MAARALEDPALLPVARGRLGAEVPVTCLGDDPPPLGPLEQAFLYEERLVYILDSITLFRDGTCDPAPIMSAKTASRAAAVYSC